MSVTERKFNLPIYLLIVFGLSWPFQIVSVLGPRTILWASIWNSLTMIMVGVATIICAKWVFQDGLRDAGWRWGGRKYWLFAIGYPALVWIVPAVIDLARGNLQLPKTLTWTDAAWLFDMLVLVMIPAFGEEIGWRGYMLPRMARVMSGRKAVVWGGIIWYVWHWPLIGYAMFRVMQASSPEVGVIGAALFAVGALIIGAPVVILLTAIFSRLWAASGSIAVVTLMHGLHDGFRDSIGAFIGSGPMTAIWTHIPVILVGGYILFKTDWQRILTPSQENGIMAYAQEE